MGAYKFILIHIQKQIKVEDRFLFTSGVKEWFLLIQTAAIVKKL